MAQLRFKKNRLLSDNFYVRGEGTRVYFFDSDEIVKLFGSKFTIEQNAVDRRLIVNRLRKIKMYRVWLQGKFRKPLAGQTPGVPSAMTVTTDDTSSDSPADSVEVRAAEEASEGAEGTPSEIATPSEVATPSEEATLSETTPLGQE